MTEEEMPRFSKAALEKQALLDAKMARGETVTWTDAFGLMEPNPDLPDCPDQDIDSGAKCDKPHHHEGKHHAEIEW